MRCPSGVFPTRWVLRPRAGLGSGGCGRRAVKERQSWSASQPTSSSACPCPWGGLRGGCEERPDAISRSQTHQLQFPLFSGQVHHPLPVLSALGFPPNIVLPLLWVLTQTGAWTPPRLCIVPCLFAPSLTPTSGSPRAERTRLLRLHKSSKSSSPISPIISPPRGTAHLPTA